MDLRQERKKLEMAASGKSVEVLKSWIDALQDDSQLLDELSIWEANFVESVEGQLRRKGYLSDRQIEILETIYAAKTK